MVCRVIANVIDMPLTSSTAALLAPAVFLRIVLLVVSSFQSRLPGFAYLEVWTRPFLEKKSVLHKRHLVVVVVFPNREIYFLLDVVEVLTYLFVGLVGLRSIRLFCKLFLLPELARQDISGVGNIVARLVPPQTVLQSVLATQLYRSQLFSVSLLLLQR